MKDIPTIHSLIETLKDGEEGFRVASEDAQSPELRSLFNDFSLERARFASQLQSLARALGDPNPTDHGSIAGALHRGWIDLKAAVVSRNAHAVLAECERGEDLAIAEYAKALADSEVSSPVRAMLSSQYPSVKAAHDRVRYLRDATAEK